MTLRIEVSEGEPALTVAVPKPTQRTLVGLIQAAFDDLPDKRRPSNATKYEVADAALSAFAVFFSQSPSFLDWQIRMEQAQGKNNAASMFGVHQIPSLTQIRNLLDPVAPSTLFPVMSAIGDLLFQQGHLNAYRSVGGTFLVAFDGTDFFASQNISCPCCSSATMSNGATLYRHIALTPVIVAPDGAHAIALPPEFVEPQDGHAKQDCELAAAKRWLGRWGAHYAARGMTVLGDDLYCHQPFCQQVVAAGAHFILSCQPQSHVALYEWVDELARMDKLGTLSVARREGKKKFTDTYRYAADLPLKNGADALIVNWCELVTTDDAGKIAYRNAWASSHRIDAGNIMALVAAGRARWKIENENNNTLKNKGYHFEHNFGHGKQNLSNLLATMILMAFLVHTALDLLDIRYRAVRAALPSRRTFFEHVRALLHYLPFDNWDHLMTFMLASLTPKPNKTG